MLDLVEWNELLEQVEAVELLKECLEDFLDPAEENFLLEWEEW